MAAGREGILRKSFRWEDELRASFEKHAHQSLWSRSGAGASVLAVKESYCSDGRADLVWTTLFDDWEPELSEDALNLLTQPTCSRILSLLKPEAARREDYLLSRTGVGQRTLRYWLDSLFESELIEEIGEGRWVLSSDFEFPSLEICSFEFKLDNWRRALYQATRYRTFSHRVFVVMPPESSTAALKSRAAFERLNIGLISHSVHGESHVRIPSRKRDPVSRHRFIMALGMMWLEPELDTYL